MKKRLKLCDDCAFRKGSRETNTPRKLENFLLANMGRIFACHKTMFDKNKRKRKGYGNYDVTRRPDGSLCDTSEHLMCAGYAALFADEFNVDLSRMDISGHVLPHAILTINSIEG